MRREFVFAIAAFICASFAVSRHAAADTPPAAPRTTTPTPAEPNVYYAGPGVTAPKLLSRAVPTPPAKHCHQVDGIAVFAAVVDANGVPHDLRSRRENGNSLDEKAREIIEADRFEPGTHAGMPVPVATLIEADVSACMEKEKDESGTKHQILTLRSPPIQILEVEPASNIDKPLPSPQPAAGQTDATHRVVAPAVLHWVEAQYSDATRKARINGSCLVSLIVDAQGKPRDIWLVRSLLPSLDQNAIEAIKQYRFKPAMKDGVTPVPVMITIEVDFRLY